MSKLLLYRVEFVMNVGVVFFKKKIILGLLFTDLDRDWFIL